MEPPPSSRFRRRPSLEPMPPPGSPNRHPFCRTASLTPARSELQLLEQLLQAASPTNTIPGAHLQPISPSATFHQRRHSAHANSVRHHLYLTGLIYLLGRLYTYWYLVGARNFWPNYLSKISKTSIFGKNSRNWRKKTKLF